MALAGGAVASWLVSNGPSLVEWAVKLYNGSRESKAEMSVPAPVEAGSSRIDPEKLAEAIREIEASLLTLNSQVTDAGLLLTKLAESNAALSHELKSQRSWLLGLAMLAAVSAAVAVTALIAALT